MSKRVGFLIENIADPDNLRLAFWKACKGKEAKEEVIAFRENLDANLLCLRNELLNGRVAVGNPIDDHRRKNNFLNNIN
jgi:RNA-directed DNA polymerase